MDRQPVTMKEFRAAMTAHNARMESPSFNENYNVAHKLGSQLGRAICRMIATGKCGDAKAKISKADCTRWAQGMLPVGAGYPSQDTHPWLAEVVNGLK